MGRQSLLLNEKKLDGVVILSKYKNGGKIFKYLKDEGLEPNKNYFCFGPGFKESPGFFDGVGRRIVRGMLLSAKVSIIILISYNKYPLNLFTLYSLEKQTF